MTTELFWTVTPEDVGIGAPPPPSPGADAYLAMFVKLLPTGHAWRLDPDGVVMKLLRGLAQECARVEQRARDLIEEMDVRTATAEGLLPDWERVLGLPEKCGTPPTTLDARRRAAHAKLTQRSVGTVPFMLELAAKLGYPDAEILSANDPFVCTSECTHALYGADGFWDSTFLLLPNGTTENDGTLHCLVQQFAQAHEIAIFEEPFDWGGP